MELNLVIKKEGGHCHDDCHFLDKFNLSTGARCSLFNEMLRPYHAYGFDWWVPCSDCNMVSNKAVNKETE